MELSFEMMYTLRKQLFSNGIDHACERWTSSLYLLLNSEKINHLWIDRDFRNGFQNAERIAQAFFDAIGKTSSEDQDELIEKIADEILYPGNPREVEKLLGGVIALLPEIDESDMEDTKEIIKDLKVILILCRGISEIASNHEKYTKEMEALTLGELEGPKKAKRKPMMEAA